MTQTPQEVFALDLVLGDVLYSRSEPSRPWIYQGLVRDGTRCWAWMGSLFPGDDLFYHPEGLFFVFYPKDYKPEEWTEPT